MCFQIPKKILSIKENKAIIEGNRVVGLGKLKVAPGDYVLVYGNIATDTLSKEQALYTRRMIGKINK